MRDALRAELPQVTLLTGPPSIGKRTMAEWALAHHGIRGVDLLTTESPSPSNPAQLTVSMDDASRLLDHASRRPMGALKGATIRLDLMTGPEPANALLKLLEEPPPYLRVVMTASKPVILTIRSRATTFPMGRLSDEEVAEVLRRRGYADGPAMAAARRAGGSVAMALADEERRELKGAVLTLLRATATGDLDLLWAGLARVGEGEAALLRRFCYEAITQDWREFEPEECFGLQQDRSTVERIEQRLRTRARPRIAARYALLPAAEERHTKGGNRA